MSTEKKPSRIDENTVIPIGFAIMLLIGILRVESTASTTRQNEKDIDSLKADMKVLQKINTRLSRIEGALGVKVDEE